MVEFFCEIFGCPLPGFEPWTPWLVDGHSATELLGKREFPRKIKVYECIAISLYTLIFARKSFPELSSSVAERRTTNQEVLGSNPVGDTKI